MDAYEVRCQWARVWQTACSRHALRMFGVWVGGRGGGGVAGVARPKECCLTLTGSCLSMDAYELRRTTLQRCRGEGLGKGLVRRFQGCQQLCQRGASGYRWLMPHA
jgi:hypothetical protein